MRPTSAHLAAGADEDGVRRDRGVADVGGGAALDHLLEHLLATGGGGISTSREGYNHLEGYDHLPEHLLTAGAAASGRDAWACMQQSASASRSASQQATRGVRSGAWECTAAVWLQSVGSDASRGSRGRMQCVRRTSRPRSRSLACVHALMIVVNVCALGWTPSVCIWLSSSCALASILHLPHASCVCVVPRASRSGVCMVGCNTREHGSSRSAGKRVWGAKRVKGTTDRTRQGLISGGEERQRRTISEVYVLTPACSPVWRIS